MGCPLVPLVDAVEVIGWNTWLLEAVMGVAGGTERGGSVAGRLGAELCGDGSYGLV